MPWLINELLRRMSTQDTGDGPSSSGVSQSRQNETSEQTTSSSEEPSSAILHWVIGQSHSGLVLAAKSHSLAGVLTSAQRALCAASAACPRCRQLDDDSPDKQLQQASHWDCR